MKNKLYRIAVEVASWVFILLLSTSMVYAIAFLVGGICRLCGV